MLKSLKEGQLSGMRLKEVLILMMGYAVAEIQHILVTNKCQEVSGNKQVQIKEFSFQMMLEQFLLEMSKNLLIKRKYLVMLFQKVLDILKSNLQTFLLNKQLELNEIFKLLIIQGLNTSELQESELVKVLFQKFLQVSKNKILEQIKSNDLVKSKESYELKENIILLQQHQVFQPQHICEICCCPISTESNSPQRSVKIHKCQHQFHDFCLIQMIKQNLQSQSDIISYPNQQKDHSQKLSQLTSIFTRLKCPNFQFCSVYLNLQEIHNLLVDLSEKQLGQNKQNQKYSLILQKIYDQTFHQYLINKNVKSFGELNQRFRNSQIKMNQQSPILFYCQTPGCNAIFQIDDQTKTKNENNQITCDKADNFICLSCRKPFCLKCFSTLHPKMTCKQNLISNTTLPQDQQLQKFIKSLKKPYKKCPKCRFYVQNWRGCSTVKCRCGTQFCFKCGNIGCPHAKCLKQIQKQQQQKNTNQKQQQTKNRKI